MLSQKCLYAIRAVFELSKKYGRQRPLTIAEIASAQAIPSRFLEAILNQLKQGGIVSSRRGKEGGYLLQQAPRELPVGTVIELIEGPVAIVDCRSTKGGEGCPFETSCVFMPLWERARRALKQEYDRETFHALLERAKEIRAQMETACPDYSI